ncbi:MAG: BatA domain-containing protein, partial [Planctomycetaceae bacterium]|nr:BatA domain-containing protein [Planctomycetaceae bacterium]
MSFDFLNPMMLLGLLGISLPVLVHLLSRKKYDVVQWGAMQFL